MRLQEAYNELMTVLFGAVPLVVQEHSVTRSAYTEALGTVEERYNIQQGDPDYIEWVLTLLGRSPVIVEKGADEDHG